MNLTQMMNFVKDVQFDAKVLLSENFDCMSCTNCPKAMWSEYNDGSVSSICEVNNKIMVEVIPEVLDEKTGILGKKIFYVKNCQYGFNTKSVLSEYPIEVIQFLNDTKDLVMEDWRKNDKKKQEENDRKLELYDNLTASQRINQPQEVQDLARVRDNYNALKRYNDLEPLEPLQQVALDSQIDSIVKDLVDDLKTMLEKRKEKASYFERQSEIQKINSKHLHEMQIANEMQRIRTIEDEKFIRQNQPKM